MGELQHDMDGGRRIDRDFAGEDIRFRAKIISSEYAGKCIELINKYDLSHSCKITLIDLVAANFDPNAVLARTENVSMRIIKFQVALIIAVTAMDFSDTSNPGLLNITQSMTDAFGDFISRSIGGKERDAITKIETHSSSHYSGLNPQPEQRGIQLPNIGGRRQQ
jgi:hypothetical protein